MAILTARGVKIRSSSQRRYVLVQVYQAATPIGEEQRLGASIVKRSDSLGILSREISRQGFWAGRTFHVFDQTTGREITA